MKFLKLAILLLLATIVLACESAEEKAVEETHKEYTGKDNSLTGYIAWEKDVNGNDISGDMAADYHREDGQHTDFREIAKYEEVAYGGKTIVARAIIKEDVFSTYMPINKLTITPKNEDSSYTYKAKFTPNQELFPNSEPVVAKSGETITFDFGDATADVGGDITSHFGLLEVYKIIKDNPDSYEYDYFTVLNQ